MTRIVYHPAPLVRPDGTAEAVAPVDLGTDPDAAERWVRRRLGVGADAGPAVLFLREALDLAPGAPAAAAAPGPAAAVPDEDAPDR